MTTQDDDHHLDLSQIELEFQRSRLIALLSELGLAAVDNQHTERDLTADNLGERNLPLNIIIIDVIISNIILTADNFSRCKLRLNVNLTSITLFRFCGLG